MRNSVSAKSSDSQGIVDHSQRAYKGIRRMLYYKELVPGQKIACRELAERLKMSSTPVIQALKWLEFQGFVLHEPNRGYYMEPFSLKEIEEIYELRELLEPSLISEAVKRLDKGSIKQLKKALDAHLSAGREAYLRERLFRNVDFHLALASLSEKPTQIRVLRTIFDILVLKYGGNYLPVVSMESVDNAHRGVFESVVSGDARKAKATLSRHISDVKKRVVKSFKKMLEEKEESEV
ncbi:MAG: GntR family transcriptional regulator [Thermodesulfobacteriota bacterium]|nr:GntR family transcriptional regulator [Thermodesulfobacteriota bacterium]